MSIRLIRCNNSSEVTPFDDAVIFHSAKGHDYTGRTRGGVFEKVYEEMRHIRDNVNHKFILQSGMAMLYGRQFEIPQNETIEFEISSLAGKYCVVYVEVKNTLVEVQPESGGAAAAAPAAPAAGEEEEEEVGVEYEDEITISAKLEYSSGSYPSIGNTDLIANRYGTATMPLYRFRVDVNGVMGDIEDLRYIYRAGVAEKARSMDGDAVVNNRKLANLVFPDKDMVRHADHAYYADRATSLGTTGVSVSRNKINDDLSLPGKGAYLVTTQIFQLKDANTLWTMDPAHGEDTYTINGLPTSVKGFLFHACVTGSDGSVACGYTMNDVLNIGQSNVKFTMVCNGGYQDGQDPYMITISVSGGTATVKLKNKYSGTGSGPCQLISGSLYLVLFIAGGTA